MHAMKSATAVFCLTLLLLALPGIRLSAQAPAQATASASAPAAELEDAMSYNDYIVDQQSSIGRIMIALQEEMNKELLEPERLWSIYDSLLHQIDESLNAVKALPPYEDNVDLRNSAVELLQFYQSTVALGYKTLLEILIRQEFSESDMQTLNQILETVTAEEAIRDQRFQEAQNSFASTHNMELQENELNEFFNK